MSGFGERFRRAGFTVPKPMIEIATRSIISYVADLFPGEDNFLFVCNEDHLADEALDLRPTLRAIRPMARIAGIAPHRKGPVYAVSQMFDAIDDIEPVIVNYCDFTCYWDYPHFKRFLAETRCDGAIPAYRGFHPHSLGSTFYAYLRERDGWVLDIQEKRPFTEFPTEEYASSGTYYFSSGALMKQTFREAMYRDFNVNGEYYVSLAYKPLLEAGRHVAVYELQHFMQWGTPDDLQEYCQYDAAFRRLARVREHKPPQHAGALILPMAGAGARFVAEGYKLPKPLIPVSGRPMAIAAAHDLPRTDLQIFVLRRDLREIQEIVKELERANPNGRIVVLDKLSDGQAMTCLAAFGDVDPACPVTIGACDTGLLYDAEKYEALLQDDSCDIIIWGFRGHAAARRKPNAYGWINVTHDLVRAVHVKATPRDAIATPVVIGTFTFKRASDFRTAVESMVKRNARVNGEYYIDTCINDAIALGLRVKLFEVDAYLSWGSPEELKTFEYWQSCFQKWGGHTYSLSGDMRVPLDSVDQLERRYATVRPRIPK
jgi:NDP-sugar pyrophosphorylase family protein